MEHHRIKLDNGVVGVSDGRASRGAASLQSPEPVVGEPGFAFWTTCASEQAVGRVVCVGGGAAGPGFAGAVTGVVIGPAHKVVGEKVVIKETKKK